MPTDNELPRRTFPCGECPVRRDNADNPASKFPAERWDALYASIDGDAGFHQPIFACHMGAPGTNEDLACAGWLASFGDRNIPVRMAIVTDRLDPAALAPGPRWPDLYDDWTEMAAAQTADPNGERAMPDTTGPPERLLLASEVADLFRVDYKTVVRWDTEGRLKAIRTPGGQRRWREFDVRARVAGLPLPVRDANGNVVPQSPSRPDETAVDARTPGGGV